MSLLPTILALAGVHCVMRRTSRPMLPKLNCRVSVGPPASPAPGLMAGAAPPPLATLKTLASRMPSVGTREGEGWSAARGFSCGPRASASTSDAQSGSALPPAGPPAALPGSGDTCDISSLLACPGKKTPTSTRRERYGTTAAPLGVAPPRPAACSTREAAEHSAQQRSGQVSRKGLACLCWSQSADGGRPRARPAPGAAQSSFLLRGSRSEASSGWYARHRAAHCAGHE